MPPAYNFFASTSKSTSFVADAAAVFSSIFTQCLLRTGAYILSTLVGEPLTPHLESSNPGTPNELVTLLHRVIWMIY